MHARRSGPSTDSGYSRPRGDHSVDELLAHDAPLIGTLPRGRTALSRDALHTQYSPTAPCGILEETASATFTSSAHKTHHAPPPSRRPAQWSKSAAYTSRRNLQSTASARPYTRARPGRKLSPKRRADTRCNAPTLTSARRPRTRAHPPHGSRDKTCIRTSRAAWPMRARAGGASVHQRPADDIWLCVRRS
ncbi:hypothetical protein CERSUDRAFT_101145 [Gelatoporia subvermispora B]|uniref:Uncharacterized protein n=1 Tax=Ceriporiopsis subvermispora (strain B) TaxID=914234 RepID=M2QF42_CERS8|nr:hypothetical protein CERSUDRAFT_101145 [Gelatoporia subvermispora B]